MKLHHADERELGKLDMFHPKPGDVVTMAPPGGSGRGDPLERPPTAVLEDVLDGHASHAVAKRQPAAGHSRRAATRLGGSRFGP